jgi:DNA-binding NarL/FixJ family response regulator
MNDRKTKGSETRDKRKARILVVDDHPFLREGIIQFVNRQDDMIVCGEADSAANTYQGVEKNKPDLLLLDLRLGQADGIELIKGLKAFHSELPILVISQHDESIFAERSIRAGASGYVTKQEATNEVMSAIRTVLAGELYVSRKIAAMVFRKAIEAREESPRAGVERLSDRELQVFQMLGGGLSSRQIATELNLSLKTIETHRENIKHKLDLQSAEDLVRAATSWVQQNFPSEGGGEASVVWKHQA